MTHFFLSGIDELRKSAHTENAMKVSGSVSPLVSLLGKRVQEEMSSPVRGGVASVRRERRASIFDDEED